MPVDGSSYSRGSGSYKAGGTDQDRQRADQGRMNFS